MRPLSCTESPSFIAIVHAGASDVNMCRKTLWKKIENQVLEVKAQIVKKLKEVDYVRTTTDIWSARQRSYLGMTCHWINLK